MISLFDNARQIHDGLPLMTKKLQMQIRRSGYLARLGMETTARVVRDCGVHNARR